MRHDPEAPRRVWRGYLAGDDEARAAELVAGLTEPDVDIVWFARGGSGGARILERVLQQLAGVPPKVVVGFSDGTSLLNALSTRLGWVTFHGPVVTTLGRRDPQTDLDTALALWRGEREQVCWSPAVGGGDPICGTLVGGNLTVLASLAGTPALGRVNDALWLLEEVAEPPYRIDRCFWQPHQTGMLEGARGSWVGALGLAETERRVCLEAIRTDAPQLPVLVGAPAGHRGTLDVLPLGARVRLDPQEGCLQPLEPWVEHG